MRTLAPEIWGHPWIIERLEQLAKDTQFTAEVKRLVVKLSQYLSDPACFQNFYTDADIDGITA